MVGVGLEVQQGGLDPPQVPEILVAVGQQVTAGQELARIEATDLENSLANAQNTLASAASVAAEGVIRGTQGDGRVAWIDARDVAAVAAEVLLGRGHDGKAYEITGPALLSQGDLAGRIAVAIGRPVAYVDVPEPEMRQRLIDSGMPAWLANEVLALAAWWRADGDAHVTDGVAGLTAEGLRTR